MPILPSNGEIGNGRQNTTGEGKDFFWSLLQVEPASVEAIGCAPPGVLAGFASAKNS